MNNPVFRPVILSHQIKKDGTCNIKIRVTHKRKVAYIPTNIFAGKTEYDKEYQLKPAALLRCSEVMKKIDRIIEECDIFEFEYLDVKEVVKFVSAKLRKPKKFKLDFFEWGNIVADRRPKYSGNNYRTALNSFAGFLQRERIDIAEITSSLLRKYQGYLEDKHGKDARAVSLYTSALATIHSEARKIYNDNELGEIVIKNPFEFYNPPKQKQAAKRGVESETIQKLIDIRGELDTLHRLAVDVFLLSFALMGTNVPDLYDAKKEDDVIYYNRTKTRERRHDNAEMRIRMEPVCSWLFDSFADPDNVRAFNLYHQYTFYKSIADKANDRLKVVAKRIGVQPFTMYSARHTWASIAYSIGIPKSLINDCLCHVDPNMSVTDIYIKKDWSILWEANKKVLSQFKWHDL